MSKWYYLLLLVFLVPRSHSKENSTSLFDATEDLLLKIGMHQKSLYNANQTCPNRSAQLVKEVHDKYANASNLLEVIREQYLFLKKTYTNVCTIKTGTNITGP
ncbi:uncharacterized protein LOC119547869 [Drosophila subpulchrella]|uniref:uncharacterized protein LOC119547869 n=1 Tax=Drosophila subpulchrella TaxID=1486046 RepID=UPI0018A15744|nr:uncharacterized protein LOC119547869 [Drosophila subpulchrella]